MKKRKHLFCFLLALIMTLNLLPLNTALAEAPCMTAPARSLP